MEHAAFAAQLELLNTALTNCDDAGVHAALVGMEWVVPGSAERMAHSLIASVSGSGKNAPAVLVATRGLG